MKLLLTGGSGFIGRNLLETLGRKHEVLAPSHRALDVTDTAAVDRIFREHRFDAVLHCAVQGGDRVFETTLRGYWNLTRHADDVGRLFYFGSGAEYGKQRDLVKVSESEIGRVVPQDAYGLAKLFCNEDARRRPRITNLRLFGVYGPHEGYLFRFISNSIVKTLLGLDIIVRQDVVFDYLYVEDLVAVVERFLETETALTDVNVTPTESISLQRILATISSVASGSSRVVFENGGFNHQYTGHNGRLLGALPDFPFTPYEVGIRRLYEHYALRRETLDRDAVLRDDFRLRCRPRNTEQRAE
ncbi:MAG TPA: NAD-dependent epimerase/dehydratase family protein [Thermoanaerobaculia bacterium]